MTIRYGKRAIQAVKLVPVDDPEWWDVMRVVHERVVADHPGWKRFPFEGLLKVLEPVQNAVESETWLLSEPDHPLRVVYQQWVAEHLPLPVVTDVKVKNHPRYEKGPKRCLFVWHDEHGWNQCWERRIPAHYHDAMQTRGGWRFVESRHEGYKSCLGVRLYHADAAGTPVREVRQCWRYRDECEEPHEFYASLRLDPEGTMREGSTR